MNLADYFSRAWRRVVVKIKANATQIEKEKAVAEIPVPKLDEAQPGDAIPIAGEAPQGEEPKRKRGRPRKSDVPTGAPQATPEEIKRASDAMGGTFKALGMILSRKRGEFWEMTDEECQALGESWGNALAPYLPRIGKAVPFAAAIAVTIGVLGPRAEEDLRRQNARKLSGPQPVPPTKAKTEAPPTITPNVPKENDGSAS